MTWRPAPLNLLLRATLFGAAAAGAVGAAVGGDAYAQRAVALTFQEKPGYGRITAKWADGDDAAPKVSASVSSQVLILKFDQKVTLDLDAVKKNLPAWAALTRMDPDGTTARIGLKQASRVKLTTSMDIAAIDLIQASQAADPPPILSPLVAKKAAETEATRVAALPPPPGIDLLEVRGSHAGDSSRLAFYWPGRVTYKVVDDKTPGQLKILFARRAKADLAYLKISPPPNLADFKGENTDKGYLVSLTAKDSLPIRHFMDGDLAVIDISKAAGITPAPATKADPEAAPKPAAARPVASKPAAAPAAKPTSNKPSLLAPPKELMAEADAPKPPYSAAAPQPASATQTHVIGGPERRTEMTASWRDPAPSNGVVDVTVLPLGSGVEFQTSFIAPAPAAVFQRNGAIWAVFGANADLKVDPTQLPIGYRVRTMRSGSGAILRIEAPKGLNVSAIQNEFSWIIRLSPTGIRPQRFLRPDRKRGDDGRTRIETMLIGAAGLVWLEDPAVGDQIAVAVAYGPTSGSATPRDWVEASLPVTAHGLAIVPKSDDALVTMEGERVVVSMAAGQTTGGQGEASGEPEPAANAAYIDFPAWGAAKGEAFYKRRAELERAAASVEPETPPAAAALMDLARFYVGHEMGFEAIGVLRLAASQQPEMEQRPAWVGLMGAALIMSHRLKLGEETLAKGALRGDPSAALWRAYGASLRGDWERAAELFREADEQIYAYPGDWSARFLAAQAEAAYHVNDLDGARRLADQVVATSRGEAADKAQLVLANVTAAIDGPKAAYPMLEKLSKEAVEPVAVAAELKRLELAVPAGKMTANDAAGALETLRFRWRGDGVEMATVGILSDQYMRVGRFREALALAQSAAVRDGSAPGARDLRIRLADYFRRLYLDGEADRLDPIQALALFYEFKTLTPIGTDGDQMIRKLAQRLVAFDLLEPAAELLQYQVDNRMRGISKASIAVDLASIYLMDRRPDRALSALNGSRQPSLPKDLALERRLIEAAAYRDLGRYDHTIELVEPLEGREAKSLLADAYWRERQWPEAARAFAAMLSPAGQAAPADSDVALKAAIAARMARDEAQLAALRAYLPVFEGKPDKASYDLLTSKIDGGGAAVSEAVRRLADAPRVDAFASAMKQRFAAPKAAQTSAATPPPAPPSPAPPSPAQAPQTGAAPKPAAAPAKTSGGGQ